MSILALATTSHIQDMNSMKLVFLLHFISWKKTPNDAVIPQRQNQFAPKIKAKAVPLLLSSLVWIDQYNECYGMTNFLEFMNCTSSMNICLMFVKTVPSVKNVCVWLGCNFLSWDGKESGAWVASFGHLGFSVTDWLLVLNVILQLLVVWRRPPSQIWVRLWLPLSLLNVLVLISGLLPVLFCPVICLL